MAPSVEPSVDILDAVLRWAVADADERRALARYQSLRWWQLSDRWSWRANLRRLDTRQRAARAPLPADAFNSVARGAIVSAWEKYISRHHQRNAFHPDFDVERLAQTAAITTQVLCHPLRTRYGWQSVTLGEIPDLAQMITESYTEGVLTERAAQLRAIAADPEFLHRTGELDSDKHYEATIIQHRASGLRALFVLPTSSRPFGTVQSKPYKIQSIDPDRPGVCHDWRPYAGLGIGTRIYEQAADLHPAVRWASSALSPYSMPVRRKLHARDPYAWDWPSCTWCADRTIYWSDADPADFVGHA